jgi:hypothetical protein
MLKKSFYDFFRKARRLQAPLARTPQVNCGSPSPRPVDFIDRDSRHLGVFLVEKRTVKIYIAVSNIQFFRADYKSRRFIQSGART